MATAKKKQRQEQTNFAGACRVAGKCGNSFSILSVEVAQAVKVSFFFCKLSLIQAQKASLIQASGCA